MNSNLARRPDSPISNNFGNCDENLCQDRRDISSGIYADYGQNSVGTNSHAEINRLSSEFHSRISREMDEMVNSVSVQIQRAINDALSNQGLPQIQNAIMAGSGHTTRKGWNVLAEEPEANSEVLRNVGTRDTTRSEHIQNDDQPNHNAYDTHSALSLMMHGFNMKNAFSMYVNSMYGTCYLAVFFFCI